MKKDNLFKAVGIVILTYILFSWIVPIIYGIAGIDTSEVSYQIGFVSIISVILETFSGFGTIVLYVLLVGAFYGVLKVTGAYDKILELFSNKIKGRELCFLITVIVVMALISSIVGLDLGLLLFFPILTGIIVKVGYDKLVALSATVGATVIGMYGSTFSSTLYGINSQVLGLKLYDQIIPKIILFYIGLILLIVFVIMYCKKKDFKFENVEDSSKKNISKSKTKKEVKVSASKSNSKTKKDANVKSKKTKSKEKKERTAIPAIVIMASLLLLFILGTTSWEALFGSNLFNDAHQAWTGFKIGGFEILNNLFGGIDAMGTWSTPDRFKIYSILLIFAMIALAIIYRIKPEECFDGFVDGIKSFVVPAFLTILVCSVFVFVYHSPVIMPVSKLMLTPDFNVALSGIHTILNSVFFVDYYYLANSVLYEVSSIPADKTVLSILSVMFTNLYSLVMLIAPTSVLLIVSLAINEVKYTEWIKFIWKLFIALFIVSFIVFSVMLLVL